MLTVMFLCTCRFLWISPSNNQERTTLLCCIQKLQGRSNILTTHPSSLWGSELSPVNSTGRQSLASVSKTTMFKEACRCVLCEDWLNASWQNINLLFKWSSSRWFSVVSSWNPVLNLLETTLCCMVAFGLGHKTHSLFAARVDPLCGVRP